MKQIILSILFLLPNIGFAYSLDCKSVNVPDSGYEIHDDTISPAVKHVMIYDGDTVDATMTCDVLDAEAPIVLSIHCEFTLGNETKIVSNMIVKDGAGESSVKMSYYNMDGSYIGEAPPEPMTCTAM